MSAHTPGPWKSQLSRSRTNRIQVSAKDGKQIALIWRHSAVETFANKNLVTAAPELLAAAEEAANFLAGVEGMSRNNIDQMASEALATIQAAIAKATGAAP